MEEIVSVSEDKVVSFLLKGVSTPIGHLTQDGGEEVLIISDLHPELWGWDSSFTILAEQFGPLWIVWPSNELGRTHIEYWGKEDPVILSETISPLTRAYSALEAVRAARILLSLRRQNVTQLAV